MHVPQRGWSVLSGVYLAHVSRVNFTRMVFIPLRLFHPLLQSFHRPSEDMYLGLDLTRNSSTSRNIRRTFSGEQ